MLYPKTHPWLPPLVSLCLFLLLSYSSVQAQVTQDIDDLIGWSESPQSHLPEVVPPDILDGLKSPPASQTNGTASQIDVSLKNHSPDNKTRAHPSPGSCANIQFRETSDIVLPMAAESFWYRDV